MLASYKLFLSLHAMHLVAPAVVSADPWRPCRGPGWRTFSHGPAGRVDQIAPAFAKSQCHHETFCARRLRFLDRHVYYITVEKKKQKRKVMKMKMEMK